MTNVLKTENDAKTILQFYNSFHDGFIKSICLKSNDHFKPNKDQICSGSFDVSIDFAHHNYNEGKPKYNQMIHADFKDVKDFILNAEGVKKYDWSINAIIIERSKRISENTKKCYESCFVFKVVHECLDAKSNEWNNVEKELFTFSEAKFKEK